MTDNAVAQITGDWIAHEGSQALCALLQNAGHQVYFVGGCVRDDLLGRPVGDVDMATSAPAAVVIELAEKAGMKAIATGIDHGTVTIIAKHRAHEVTSFRQDINTDGRRAQIKPCDDYHQDAARRDFTMNALYADARGQVFDPIGGIEDLRARRVRFIGDADTRIREDYLRILRYFRFNAWFMRKGDGLDADDLAVISEHLDGLNKLSAERIWAEVKKLLSAPDPAPAVAAMAACGVLGRLFTGAQAENIAPLVHFEMQLGWPADPLVRFAALSPQKDGRALRASRQERRQIDLMRRLLGAPDGVAAIAQDHGSDTARALVLLRAALLHTPPDPKIDTLIVQAAKAVFPLRASDLPPELQGAQIGAALRHGKAVWVASGFVMSKAEILKNLK